MKRPITQALSICLVLFGCHAASADEAQEFLKYFSWWEGEWEVETKMGDIQTSNMTIERHEPGCHTVKGAGISLWGYDPHLKTWVGTGFLTDGSRFTDVLQPLANNAIRPGVVDKSKRESWQADGTKILTESTWTYKDDDTAVIQQFRKTASGAELPTIVLTCKRKK